MRERWRVAIVPLAVLVAVAGLALAGDDDDDAAPDRALGGFRIVYDVEVHLPSGDESSRREVVVRRPFDGSDLTFADGADRPQSGSVAVGGHLFTIQQETAYDAGSTPPELPPGELRFAALLGDLVRLELLRERGEDRIAGRECVVFRSGAPLGDPFRAPSADEHVDWCIDSDGLLLRERWFLDGKLLRETTAVEVETNTPAAEQLELVVPTAPNPGGSSTTRELTIDEPPDVGDEPYHVATGAVEGFTLDSRWRSVTTETATGVPQVQDIVFVDVYRRDLDVVFVLHREQAVAGEQSVGYEAVDVDGIGEAQVFLDARAAELRIELDPWIVSVRGTLPVAALADFAATLRPIGR